MSLCSEGWIWEQVAVLLRCRLQISTSCTRRFRVANLWSSGLFIKHFCYGGSFDVSCRFFHVCWWKASTGSLTARDGQEILIFIVWCHGFVAVWFTRYSTIAHSRKALLLSWKCSSQFCLSQLLLVDRNVFKSQRTSTTEVIRLRARVLEILDRYEAGADFAPRHWVQNGHGS